MNSSQVFYQIYPLGFCKAPAENDSQTVSRILHVLDWIDHMKKLGITAVYFGPVFESDRHGYDTRDYARIDCRLGTNEDFAKVCRALHDNNISVVLDGVFNHVGRGFFAFQDVLKKKTESVYCDWFYLDFSQADNDDGFCYQNWEGHPELVKLNLDNETVCQYLLDRVDQWREEFSIDGLRLDVAYCLNQNFLQKLSSYVRTFPDHFFLLGEMISGDYRQLLNCGLDSVTNYECRKGLYSSMNSHNLFEIGYSLNRQFGPEDWCLYRGVQLFSFADNQDVDRLASVLQDERDLPLVYALLFAMPGIPCIYYGSEWGEKGERSKYSDRGLRPAFLHPKWNDLTDTISVLSRIRMACLPLADGDYHSLQLTNQQMVFSRKDDCGQLIFALNIDENPCTLSFDAGTDQAVDLFTGKTVSLSEEMNLEGKSFRFWYAESIQQ